MHPLPDDPNGARSETDDARSDSESRRHRRRGVGAGLATLLLLLASVSGAGAGIQDELPASGDDARARLEASPRHGEWVDVTAGGETIDAWVVYPQRSDDAPVVVVIHEIFGLTDWIRAVADQLAAEGFIAIAPDLLSGKGPDDGGTAEFADRQAVVAAIRDLDRAEVVLRLDATAEYAMALPAATDRFGVVGFCWGGSTSFAYATRQPQLDAAVVYYGSSPPIPDLSEIEAPVLGLYGGEDQRVNATIPEARETMNELRKRYVVEIYEGAGHGFLRNQSAMANMEATRRAWPRTVAFFRQALEE